MDRSKLDRQQFEHDYPILMPWLRQLDRTLDSLEPVILDMRGLLKNSQYLLVTLPKGAQN